MGERKRDVVHQSFGVMRGDSGDHWFRPRETKKLGVGTNIPVQELQVREKTERDQRLVTNYLAAQNVIRNLQKLKAEISEMGLRDVQKRQVEKQVENEWTESANEVIKRILRG